MSSKPDWSKLNREQAHLGVREFFDKILRLQAKKNQDYGSATDGLHNFRQSAQRLGLTMPQVFMALMEKHLIALENDVRNPHVGLNEGVEDRLSDIACYCALLYLALRESDLLKRREQWSSTSSGS